MFCLQTRKIRVVVALALASLATACGIIAPATVASLFNPIISCENSFGSPPSPEKGAVTPLLASNGNWDLDQVFAQNTNGEYVNQVKARGRNVSFLLPTPFLLGRFRTFFANPFYAQRTPLIHPVVGGHFTQHWGFRVQSLITADKEAAALNLLAGEKVIFAAIVSNAAQLTVESAGTTTRAFKAEGLAKDQVVLVCDEDPTAFYTIHGGTASLPVAARIQLDTIARERIVGQGTAFSSELLIATQSAWQSVPALQAACGKTIEIRDSLGAIVFAGAVPKTSIMTSLTEMRFIQASLFAYRVPEELGVTCQ